MRTVRAALILAAVGAVLLVGFVALTATRIARGAEPGDAVVAVEDFAFTPASVTVAAGGSVTWEARKDPEQHTVTPTNDGAFAGSGSLFAGDDYTVKFDTPGRYAYLCSFHPFMTGTVVVEAAVASASAAASVEPSSGTASPDPAPGTTAPSPGTTAPSPGSTAGPAEPSVDPGTDLPIVPIALLGLAIGGGLGFLLRRRSKTS